MAVHVAPTIMLSPPLPHPSLLLLVSLAAAILLYLRRCRSSTTLPKGACQAPSPPRHWLLGHAPYIPTQKPHLQYAQWASSYGPIYRILPSGGGLSGLFSFFTTQPKTPETFIVTSSRLADELLRNRGGIYASRETSPAQTQLLSGRYGRYGAVDATSVADAPADAPDLRPFSYTPGPTLQQGRKLMYLVCRDAAARTYEPTQAREAVGMLDALVHAPERYEEWFVRFASSVILRVGYGKRVRASVDLIDNGRAREKDGADDDEALHRILAVNREFGRMCGAKWWHVGILDTFPILLRLPEWLVPGKRALLRLHRMELGLYRDLLGGVRQKMIAEGGEGAPDCWERTYLERQHNYTLTLDQGAYIMGTMYAAGAHTTAAAMTSLLRALVLHPREFELLQRDIDAVIGCERIPTFEDVPLLPRLRAIVKESLRCWPLPLDGVAHKSTRDDVVVVPCGPNEKAREGREEIFIPAGSLVQPIAWAIHRDPEVYPRPGEFLPERWLEDPAGEFPYTRVSEGRSLREYPNLKNFSVFGYGRRICPGFNIVERSLVIQVALVVWGCNLKAVGRGEQELGHGEREKMGGGRMGLNVDEDDDDDGRFPPFELKVRGERYAEIIAREAEKARREDPLR